MNRRYKITDVPASYQGVAFTSDLSARGLWLMLDKDFEPLGMVAGSCAYSVGTFHPWAVEIKGSFHGEFRKRFGVARAVAIARMQFQADQLGADGIIGVHVKFERLHNSTWMEVTVCGTAVRYMGRNPYTPSREQEQEQEQAIAASSSSSSLPSASN